MALDQDEGITGSVPLTAGDNVALAVPAAPSFRPRHDTAQGLLSPSAPHALRDSEGIPLGAR